MTTAFDRLMLVISPAARRERKRGWRVGHRGRDSFFYDELIDDQWRSLEIGGEMLFGDGDPQHVVYTPSVVDWERLPDWALGRRDEILDRIRQELPPPSYEYQ